MKLTLKTGCLLYNVDVDGKDVSFLSINELKNIIKYVINNIPDKYSYKPDVLKGLITSIILCCENCKSLTLTYGEQDNEYMYVDILQTLSYSVRCFYDNPTHEEWITVNDYHESIISFDKFKKIISEMIDVYYDNPKFKDDIISNTNQYLATLVEEFGILSDVGKKCECCGDRIYEYELNI